MSDVKWDGLKILEDDLRQKIEEYKKIDWKKLLRKEDMKHHLGEIEPNLDFIRRVLDSVLNGLLARHATDKYIFEFRDNIATCLETWLQLQRGILSHKDYSKNKDIVDRVRGYQYDMLKNLQPVLDRFKLEDRYASQEEKGFAHANDLKIEREKIQKELDEIKKLHGDISQERIMTAQQVAGQTSKLFGNEFENEAKNHAYWSYGIGTALIVLIITSIALFSCTELLSFNPRYFTSWINFIAQSDLMFKIFVLACFFHVTNILSREYMAHRHQMVVNKHRANAINSYQALSNSVLATDNDADKEASNAILVELTKFLYSTHITGFVKNAEAGKTQNLQVVDTASRVLGGRYDKS